MSWDLHHARRERGQRSDFTVRVVHTSVGDKCSLIMWGFFFADVSSEPDADLGPTWEVKCARVFVCLWVHSPAVSFCTDHINDTTEAWAVDCSLKAERRTKCEMEAEAGWRGVWGGRKGEPELRSWETKQVTERKKKKKEKKNSAEQSNNMTQHLQGNTPPSSHHLFSNFPPPPCLLLLSPPDLSLSLWDQDLFFPLTLSQQLWHARCRCCC